MVRGRPALFWLGCGLLVTLATVAVIAPWLAPHDPRLPTGRPLAPPTREHLLGTNDLGQDVLSQALYGARSSLIVAGSVTGFSTALSWLVGLLAGFSRRAEIPLMALTDLLLALPNIPFYLLALTLLGPSRSNLILVLALISWPAFARIVRSIVLQARLAGYVEASRALGAPGPHIIRRHLLPATLGVLPTKLVLTVRFAVFAEATLTFLGLGSNDVVSWGMMLNWAFSDPLLFSRPVWPWLVLPPTLALAVLVLSSVWIGSELAQIPPSRGRSPGERDRHAGGRGGGTALRRTASRQVTDERVLVGVVGSGEGVPTSGRGRGQAGCRGG